MATRLQPSHITVSYPQHRNLATALQPSHSTAKWPQFQPGRCGGLEPTTAFAGCGEVHMGLLAGIHSPILAALGLEDAHAIVFAQHLLCMLHCLVWCQGVPHLSGHLAPPLHLLVELPKVFHCRRCYQQVMGSPSLQLCTFSCPLLVYSMLFLTQVKVKV